MNGLDNVQRVNLWDQPVYANFLPEVEPFQDKHLFRPLNRAYDGNIGFWKTPSPEPDLSDQFWRMVDKHLYDEKIREVGATLAASIAEWQPDYQRLIFVAILRAGVPIADWLTRLLPGSKAIATSLFVGLGIDQVALEKVKLEYPERQIVFVDGWTGRGGVARELAKLGHGPLAVLIDPWGWADFSGCQEDVFCSTACFTGVATLGFSRTFYTASDQMFSAYLFPEKYARSELIQSWQEACPEQPSLPLTSHARFYRDTDLRLHSNEVCRALINASPQTIYFADDEAYVREHFSLLLTLAAYRQKRIVFKTEWLRDFRTRVACSLDKSK